MTKRPLTKEEVEINEKQISRLKKDLSYEEFATEYADLMLDKGLEQNYLRQRREFAEKRKMAKENYNQIGATIIHLREQIKNGVEVVEESKGSPRP